MTDKDFIKRMDFEQRISDVIPMLKNDYHLYGTVRLIKDLKYCIDKAYKEGHVMTFDEVIVLKKGKIKSMNEYAKIHTVTHEFLNDIEQEEQLVEWLEELKAYRANEGMSENVYRCGYKFGYNKCVDDFSRELSDKIMSEIDDCAEELQWIDEIAKQLKER